MRIWHEKLIPHLCRQHLLAVWREGLGAYKIITENKKAYRNHPAVKEFENNISALKYRLWKIRIEMLSRNYKPKLLPFDYMEEKWVEPKPWQTLEEQIEILKNKPCDCFKYSKDYPIGGLIEDYDIEREKNI